jgi:hypothetical protein
MSYDAAGWFLEHYQAGWFLPITLPGFYISHKNPRVSPPDFLKARMER